MSEIKVGTNRTYAGCYVPSETAVNDECSDPRQPYGYVRIIHFVEANAPSWCEFTFPTPKVVWRFVYKMKRHKMAGRYELIKAGDKLFMRAKAADELTKMIRGENR